MSRIVIDPGHGGHDPGAKGAGTTEAELVLDVSLRLAQLLEKVPGLEVVLTRKTDDYVPLQERTAIANRENADLFLSIHANANSSAQAQGVETYFLNFATTLSAAAVAARENAASGQNMGELPDVVKTIALNNKLDESRDFATFVQREMVAKLRPANKAIRDLGVKQAPFVVLIGAAMPSVLAEISFMTNPQEAKLLKSSAYRQRIAEALFEAVRTYQASLKKAPRSPAVTVTELPESAESLISWSLFRRCARRACLPGGRPARRESARKTAHPQKSPPARRRRGSTRPTGQVRRSGHPTTQWDRLVWRRDVDHDRCIGLLLKSREEESGQHVPVSIVLFPGV